MKNIYAVYGDNLDENVLHDYNPKAYEGLDGNVVYLVKMTLFEAIKLTAKTYMKDVTVKAF